MASDSPINMNIEVMLHFEQEMWHTLSFDIAALTPALVTMVSKEFLPETYHGEVSIILTNDAQLYHLNQTYRHQSKATNVLSFDYGEDAFDKGMMGDIFLSYETLAQEAKDQNKSFQDHYTHLIIHGLLHLLGYDHQEEAEAEDMEKREIEFLEKIGLSNPYLI